MNHTKGMDENFGVLPKKSFDNLATPI